MSQIRLVIADRDSMFLEKFSAYLLKSKTPSFSLELFSSDNKLAEWINKGEKADIIAISLTLYNDLSEKPDKKNLVLLRDCPESMVPEGLNSIFKYRPASILMKELISLSAEQIPQDIERETELSKINLVLYADGSDVLNPFAQSLALMKASSGQKTFYMSLDEISNTDAYFSGNNNRGLSEMLYYVKSYKDNLSLKAEACTTLDIKTGVYFMKSHYNLCDVANLTEAELSTLIMSVNNISRYDEIIITRSFSNDTLLPLLIKASHKIYITALNYFTSVERIKKINSALTKFEEENNIILKDKVLFCLTDIIPGYSPEDLNMLNYNLRHFSSPIYGSNVSFPPNEKYFSELKAIL